ncbi:folylpolyglutamate synthase/dihydrofolate synthase family protein [Lysinibacillus telephonicus]|uniref:bifunctional folylpolyglutamate synthase/dihydrofolate synthase n=1 Tax=Lysinibacillus telephonicus TaxID=1714840 RepID=UPI00397E0C72
MFQSIEQCTDFIFKLKASEYKGEPLEAVRIILEQLGNPQNRVKYIHFAGSNGKGSTLNATREILMGHGLSVGAFTSPHLERVNERITINKVQITDEQFLQYANIISDVIQSKLDGKFPSFFEIMTVLALLHFANGQIDVALIETGIGGRIDSTNIIIPEISVITTISLEHTEILGDSIEKIAYEKAGIIKDGKPVVVGVKQQEALRVIKQKAMQSDALIYCLNEDFHYENIQQSFPQTFDFKSQQLTLSNIPLAMLGLHQVENASLAIVASKLFDRDISENTIKQALQNARWEGRFERVGERIIIDGAHNSEGTAALIKTLKQVYPNKSYKFVYAALMDKDHGKSIAMMDQVASAMRFTEIPLPRAAKADYLASQSKHPNIISNENWKQLIQDEEQNLLENELLIITGSLYFIAEVRTYLSSFSKRLPPL